MLTFSVVLCTHNRASYLADAIRSVQGQDFFPTSYEIIVVDNASTDETPRVVRSLASNSAVPLRYVHEPRVGLSLARNVGAQASRKDIVAYIDDDAIADSKWLACLDCAFTEFEHELVCVAGGVQLIWERAKPSWFPNDLEPYLSSTAHLGESRRKLEDNEYAVGANFAVARSILLSLNGFNSKLGRIGSSLLSGEESEFCKRLREAGGVVRYEPQAFVYHRIMPERTSLQYLLRRSFWDGVSEVQEEQQTFQRRRIALFRSAVAVFLQSVQDAFRALAFGLRRDGQAAFRCMFHMAGRLGRSKQTAVSLFT